MTDNRVNPFIEYRALLDVHARALAAGVSDADYCRLVDDLDTAVASVGGVAFRITPVIELDGTAVAASAPSRILAKIETGNVAGSHKARHLFGLLLHQRLIGADNDAPWAIASCGNAALAAAVVARSVDHHLDVFVPVDANPVILAQLEDLGATPVVCHRRPGEVGDPCMAALNEALAAGSAPFTVQGPTCPDVFDGARTLGAELADQAGDVPVTDLYLQIGGGAFAVATTEGWERRTGRPAPRLHPVQPANAHPLVAAWLRLVPSLLASCDVPTRQIDALSTTLPSGRGAAQLGAFLSNPARAGRFDALLAQSSAMEAWPTTPESIATGILDDITYDWRPLLDLQLRTGGWPVLVTEDQLASTTRWVAAELLERSIAPPPDPTGAAGLAGALFDDALTNGTFNEFDPAGSLPEERSIPRRGAVAVVLSGADRSWSD